MQKFEVILHGPRATQVKYVLGEDTRTVNSWAYTFAEMKGFSGWEILGEEEYKKRQEEGDDSVAFNWPDDIETLSDGRLAMIIPTITEEYIAKEQSEERKKQLAERQKKKKD